jgi:hypothetical protein
MKATGTRSFHLARIRRGPTLPRTPGTVAFPPGVAAARPAASQLGEPSLGSGGLLLSLDRARPLQSRQRRVGSGPLAYKVGVCLGIRRPERPFPRALLSATSASGDPDAGGRSRRPVADRCSWLLVVSRAWERSTNAPPLAVRREGSVRTVCACPSLSARSSAPARTARLRWAERSSGASGRGDLRVAEAMASVAVELTIVFVRTNVYRGMPRPMSSPVGGRTR